MISDGGRTNIHNDLLSRRLAAKNIFFKCRMTSDRSERHDDAFKAAELIEKREIWDESRQNSPSCIVWASTDYHYRGLNVHNPNREIWNNTTFISNSFEMGLKLGKVPKLINLIWALLVLELLQQVQCNLERNIRNDIIILVYHFYVLLVGTD